MPGLSKSVKNEKDDNLIIFAESKGIPVFYGNIPNTCSMSLCRGRKTYIAIDPSLIESSADGRVKIAHELGHCETSSFYTRNSPSDVMEKHEYRADKWAAHKLIPPDDIRRLIQEGYTEPWQMAEQLDVTESFVRRALYIYESEGIDLMPEPAEVSQSLEPSVLEGTSTPPTNNNVQSNQSETDCDTVFPVFSVSLLTVLDRKKEACTAKNPYKPIDRRMLDIFMDDA